MAREFSCLKYVDSTRKCLIFGFALSILVHDLFYTELIKKIEKTRVEEILLGIVASVCAFL